MRNRVLVIIAAFILIAVAAYLAYDRLFARVSDPFSAIPHDAALIVEFTDGHHDIAVVTDSAWSSFRTRGFLTRLFSDVELIRHILSDSIKQEKPVSARVLASLHKTGAEAVGFLWVVEPRSGSISVDRLLDSFPGSAREHKFRGARILEKAVGDGGTVAVVKRKGLLIISRNTYLVERAVVQLQDGEPIHHSDELRSVMNQVAKSRDPKVYLQFAQLAEALSASYHATLGKDNPLTTMAGWGAADFRMLGKKLLLNGFVSTMHDSWLAQVMTAPGATRELSSLMPASTAMFCSVHSNHFADLDRFGENAGLRDLFSTHFVHWMGSTVSLAVNEPLTDRLRDYSFLLIAIADTALARSNLLELVRIQSGAEFAEPVDARHNIYLLENFDELELLLGLPTRLFSSPAFAFRDDVVIFANSVSALSIYLDRLDAGQTLSQELDYLAFRDDFASNPNVDWYFRPGFSSRALQSIAREESVIGALLGLDPIGLQLTRFNNELFLANGVLNVTAEITGGPTYGTLAALWRVQLDAISTRRPVIITDHRSKEQGVLVQDGDHTLHLISKSGEVRWKVELTTPIVGNVNQVDYYRNGRLQFMFTTERAIHLIDVLGRDVSGYPLRLPATATSGLMIADYEDQQLPRMFVACANGNIYGYKLTGEPLPGWNPKRNVGSVPYPLEHFTSGTRDYIHYTKADGSHLLLNRMGENRRSPTEAVAGLRQGFELVREGNAFSFINVTSNGRLLKIAEDGRVTAIPLEDVSTVSSFVLTDLDGDHRPEVLVADSSAVYVFDLNGQRGGIIPLPGAHDLFTFKESSGCHECVGAFDKTNGQSWLLVRDHVDARFPVLSSAPFEIGELLGTGEPALIVCTDDGWITAYRL